MQLFVLNPVVIPDIEIPQVDGYKSGDIKIHNGTVNNIPDGWVLCNGLNGTPPMVDRAIVGAGAAYQPNQTFGSDSKGTGNHTLSSSQGPVHSHRQSGGTWAGQGGSLVGVKASGTPAVANTHNSGGGSSHNHGAIDVRQKSVAVIWIMKL